MKRDRLTYMTKASVVASSTWPWTVASLVMTLLTFWAVPTLQCTVLAICVIRAFWGIKKRGHKEMTDIRHFEVSNPKPLTLRYYRDCIARQIASSFKLPSLSLGLKLIGIAPAGLYPIHRRISSTGWFVRKPFCIVSTTVVSDCVQ